MEIDRITVGIAGCGHLGQALACTLLEHGLSKERLLLSYGGSPQTLGRLETLGLNSCVACNERLFAEADIVLLMTKPQDAVLFAGMGRSSRALIVSAMAGASAAQLSAILGADVHRTMLSGPDTIRAGKGLAAAWPGHELIVALLRLLGTRQVPLGCEAELDVFTAGVCMPAALLCAEGLDTAKQDVQKLAAEFPLLPELFRWSMNALPRFACEANQDAFLAHMATKGGITEAIVASLQRGEGFEAAMRRGIARTQEISQEINRIIAQ